MMSYLGQLPEDVVVGAMRTVTPVAPTGASLTSNTLGPSQTFTYLQVQQDVVGDKIFSRHILPRPDQPYQLQMSDAQIVRDIYSKLPTQIKKPVEEGTSPQTLVELPSGLEVPEYILKRQKAREEAAEARLEILSKQRPPLFYQVGKYAERNPGIATAAALVIGAILGNAYFDLNK